MIAEMLHRITDPHTPKMPSVNPNVPKRNPGLHIAIVNPSHHRSDFSS